ncbi:hypothetical protein BH10BAC5_BH10BAC5_09660 [soil metagenome]
MLEFIYNGFVNSSNKKSYSAKLKNIIFGVTRKTILKFGDPLISYKLWNYKIRIPISHNLPVVLNSHKNYNTNLPRVAKYISKKYKDPLIIDIGANIGDTAALLRSFVDFPIMCVEGDPNFFNMLMENCKKMKNITFVKTYLGTNDEKINASVQTERGTGTISNVEGATLETKKLDTVLEDNPEFKNAKLLKIDTDGFDFKIMKGSVQFLSSAKPVIFTEFDQNLMKEISENFNDMFEFFRSLNYLYVIFYDNFGDYLISLNLNETEKLEDITSYFSNRNTDIFCDICVFNKDDKDLFTSVRLNEIDFFTKNR